jgi:RNA polymerase sigma factor (sigma-70 family)
MPAEHDKIHLSVTATSTNLLEGLRKPENRTVWHQFVNRYQPMIMSYARSRFGLSLQDAEDAAQATLIAFAEAYQSGRYNREKGRLRKWLFGIATNQIRNLLKKRAQNREFPVPDQATGTGFINRIPDDDAELEGMWEQEWRQAVYQQCMVEVRAQTDFDDQTIEAFQLHGSKGLPAKEVADRLGMTENAVFLAKHKVLKRIRELVPLVEENW